MFSPPFYDNACEPVRQDDGSWLVRQSSRSPFTHKVEAGSDEAGILEQWESICEEARLERDDYEKITRLTGEYADWAAELPERFPGFFFDTLERREFGPFRTVKYVEKLDPCPAERTRFNGFCHVLPGVPAFVKVVPIEKAIIKFGYAWSKDAKLREYAANHGWHGKDAGAGELSHSVDDLTKMLFTLKRTGRAEWQLSGNHGDIELESAWNTNAVPFYEATNDGRAVVRFRFAGDDKVTEVKGPAHSLAPLYEAFQRRLTEMQTAREIVATRLAERGVKVEAGSFHRAEPPARVGEFVASSEADGRRAGSVKL